MFAAILPLFDENISVGAYSLFSQRDNYFYEPRFSVTAKLDGAPNIDGLEIIEKMGTQTLSSDKDIFVPVNNVSIFADIETQCSAPHSQIVIFIDRTVNPTEMYINRLNELKDEGYKIAIWKLNVSEFEVYKPILDITDYVFINCKKVDVNKAKIYFKLVYPDIKLVVCNIQTMEEFNKISAEGGFDLYEGNFYRMPVTVGQKEVAPLKVNYLELLNIVNEPDYDLTQAADVIGRDTSLVISLLKIVNRMTINSEITTIRHAAAMLGQKELKKWIITAVTKQLCFDKPNEITRVSLLRARFAENLADAFGIKYLSQELFLMGLFSVLDIILDKPMGEALEMVKISTDIKNAILYDSGDMADVLSFIKAYESANWIEVARILVIRKLEMDDVYLPYCDALEWYKKMFFEEQ